MVSWDVGIETSIVESAPQGAESAVFARAEAQWLLERQKRRFAYDLHDGPVQSLVVALQGLKRVADAEDLPHAVAAAGGVRDGVVSALDELEALISDSRPPALDGDDLFEWLTEHCREYVAQSGIETRIRLCGSMDGVTDSAQIAVFRIVQEAMSNAHLHGRASRVRVMVVVDPDAQEIRCRVADDGAGFDMDRVAEPAKRPANGLRGMAERAALLDGAIDITSVVDRGTRVSARIPLW